MAGEKGQTRARTRARTGARAAVANDAGLPKSMAALRLMVIAQVKQWRRLEALCFGEQKSKRKGDDEPYGVIDQGGPTLTFAEYRKALAEEEKALRDAGVPPATWRAAVKRAEEELEAEAG